MVTDGVHKLGLLWNGNRRCKRRWRPCLFLSYPPISSLINTLKTKSKTPNKLAPTNSIVNLVRFNLLFVVVMTENRTKNSLTKASNRGFDDLYDHVGTFGKYQRILYFSVSLILVPISCQLWGFIFAHGIPNFHCVTANVTCPPSKCCGECISYVFDGPLTSSLSEVSALALKQNHV